MDHQITEILRRIPASGSVANELMPLVYDQLRTLAANYLDNERSGHTLQATALVNDAYLKLVGRDASYESRSHFFAAAAVAMRQLLIDHARTKKASKRGGTQGTGVSTGLGTGPGTRLSLEGIAAPQSGLSPERLLEIDAAIRKLADLDDRRARVLEMRVFGGMTYEQIGLVLGIGKSTASDDWTVARAFLAAELSDDAENAS